MELANGLGLLSIVRTRAYAMDISMVYGVKMGQSIHSLGKFVMGIWIAMMVWMRTAAQRVIRFVCKRMENQGHFSIIQDVASESIQKVI